MEITDIKINLNGNKNSKLKAFGEIVLNDCLVIHNLKIIQGKQRMFVQFPDRKLNNKFVNLIHPLTSEFREKLESSIMNKYHKVLEDENV